MSNKVKRCKHRKTHILLFQWYYQYEKKFDPNNIKIDEKSYKNIHIYCIVYVTIKDSKYIKINSVNPLCLLISKANGYFEDINKNKYLTLVPTNESKEIIKNMKNCWVKSDI